MNILFSNIGNKLPISDESKQRTLKKVIELGGPWFWVVHPGLNIESFFEKDEDIPKCIEAGGALLIIGSAARCGLPEEKAIEYEKLYKNRVHFLRTRCAHSSSKAAQRVIDFLEEIENLQGFEEIPWDLLKSSEPPEHLIALYFLLRSIDFMPEKREEIEQAWHKMDETWRNRLMQQALFEFTEKETEENNFTRFAVLENGESNMNILSSPNVPIIADSIKDWLSNHT